MSKKDTEENQDRHLSDEILRALAGWFAENKRDLPWRRTRDPYPVWVSEIMLQQTRIETVLPYYDRFLRTLPGVSDLAACDEEKLLKLWEGLGYYSRVRNMLKCARVVCEEHGGKFPEGEKELKSLPGIGPYTAGAIASICFDRPYPAVDGNVLRVLSRLYDDHADVMQQPVRRRAETLMRSSLERARELSIRTGDITQGIMELGETICLANTVPACSECPLQDECLARERGTAAALPVRVVKTRRRAEERTVLIITDGEKILLHRRDQKGLLAGLYELPALDGEAGVPQIEEAFRKQKTEVLSAEKVTDAKHLFSHLEWRMQGWRVRVTPDSLSRLASQENYVAALRDEVKDTYPLPSAFAAFRPYL